ncbi:phage-related protein [Mesorhizobium sp. J18]|uniref:phage tail tape-measure protein n=1 Tax=Mesorhizobium sp. J18 TaxID=935263 RepID=UPI0011997315|nr:phage tail tape-measure protein [Mesorhizobium sp. J18]TWG90315.1 phage-related protein [Mesorhizobium sp. J18]
MDIASLGIAVDSSQADKGAVSLTKLSAAAKQAEAATKGTAAGARSAASAAAEVASQTNSAGQAAARAEGFFTRLWSALTRLRSGSQSAAQSLTQVGNAANDNARRMGGSFSGLAAQVQDIGVTAAMGMNPMIIALQQGTQIAGQMEVALQNGGTAAGVFGAALRSLISPVSLIAIGLTAVLAAGLQMVDWAQLGASALNTLASVLQTIAPYAAMAAAGLALLYAPAIIGGIVQVIALMGRLAVSAAMAAANPAAAFVLGITAAVAAANIFRDELAQIFGRDIVADAKNAVNFIIGAFVGGFNAIKTSWSLLPAAIGDLVYQAANATIGGVEKMLNFVIEKIDAFIGKIEGVISTVSGWIGQDGVRLGRIGEVKLGRPSNPYEGAATAAVDAAREAFDNAQGMDYVGAVGGAIERAAAGAADKLRDLAGSFTGVEDAAAGAGRAAKGAAEGAKDPWKGLRGEVDKTKESLSFAKDVTKGFLSDLRQGLANGEGFWKSFGNAALNVLDKIVDKIETQFVDALFSANSAASGGGGGGILGAIFGGIGKLLGFASGGYTGNGAANRVAGVVHGGEYVFSKRATDRIGVGALDQLHRRAKGYASGGYVTTSPRITPAANQNVHVTVGVSVDRNGNLQAYVKDVAQQEGGRAAQVGISQYDKSLPGRISDVMERHG